MNNIKKTTSDDKDREKELLHTVGGNVNWCNHCGKWYGEVPQII